MKDDREHERQICRRKSRFPSKAMAKNKAAIIARTDKKMRAYYCDLCYGWHLTSMGAEVERAARAERAREDG